jgi:hypothetical protein
LDLLFGREEGDVWLCSRSFLEVKEREALRCHTSDLEVTMDRNLKTLVSKPFAMTWVLNTSFRACIRPHPPEWRGGKEK